MSNTLKTSWDKKMDSLKKCKYCGQTFIKNRSWQKTCLSSKCVKLHKRMVTKKWLNRNSSYNKVYAAKKILIKDLTQNG